MNPETTSYFKEEEKANSTALAAQGDLSSSRGRTCSDSALSGVYEGGDAEQTLCSHCCASEGSLIRA